MEKYSKNTNNKNKCKDVFLTHLKVVEHDTGNHY